MNSKCFKHPKYKAKKKPKGYCDDCWYIYLNNQRYKHRAPIILSQIMTPKNVYKRVKKIDPEDYED